MPFHREATPRSTFDFEETIRFLRSNHRRMERRGSKGVSRRPKESENDIVERDTKRVKRTDDANKPLSPSNDVGDKVIFPFNPKHSACLEKWIDILTIYAFQNVVFWFLLESLEKTSGTSQGFSYA